MSAERPPLSRATKWAYGVGAIANGVNSRVVGGFALIFYNQVMGLAPALVTLAISIALVVDGFADPLVGQISDNFRSRWGRRHPFMIVSLLLYPVAFLALWNPPPGLGEAALFAWMLAFLIGVRVLDTFFELPSNALLPELVTDYNERTSLIGLRWFFGVIASIAAPVLAYQVFMPEGPNGQGGVDERPGWLPFSLACAAIIVIAILICALGTARRIPYLRAAPQRPVTLVAMAREVAATLNNRAFIVATVSGMFSSLALGLYGGLSLYFSLYFWGLTQAQLSLLALIAAPATVLGVVLAPIVGRVFGKKRGGLLTFALSVIVGNAPLVLRLLGLAPPNGSPALFALIAAEVFIQTTLGIVTVIVLSALVSDVVEDSELKTGRRSEGLLMSADNLFKKIVSGGGVLLSGWVLAAVAFPADAARHGAPPETLRNMALIYLPMCIVLWTSAVITLSFFTIDKQAHEDNLRKLGAMRAASAPAE